MNKKFFSLIRADTIRAAPKSKIIPAESLAVALEAGEVLEEIKKDANEYRLSVVKECEELKAAAEKEGYEAGYKKWAEELVRLEEKIEKANEETQKLIIPVALTAAKKIVARELESTDAIVDIVAANLKAVAAHKKITIYVSKKDRDVIEQNKSKLKALFESLESLSIREKEDLQPGSCVIETEIGIINAQMEHRWNILEKAFEKLGSKAISAPTKSEE